jgi:hypothetical protein
MAVVAFGATCPSSHVPMVARLRGTVPQSAATRALDERNIYCRRRFHRNCPRCHDLSASPTARGPLLISALDGYAAEAKAERRQVWMLLRGLWHLINSGE